MNLAALEPRPLDPESNALTIRPLSQTKQNIVSDIFGKISLLKYLYTSYYPHSARNQVDTGTCTNQYDCRICVHSYGSLDTHLYLKDKI